MNQSIKSAIVVAGLGLAAASSARAQSDDIVATDSFKVTETGCTFKSGDQPVMEVTVRDKKIVDASSQPVKPAQWQYEKVTFDFGQYSLAITNGYYRVAVNGELQDSFSELQLFNKRMVSVRPTADWYGRICAGAYTLEHAK